MDREELLRSLKILYVEDEELMRKNLSMLLQRRVNEIFVAENGKEGLSRFDQLRPDVVITDIEMPVMNGIEMIKKIKEIDASKPVIILTAFNDEEHDSELADTRLVKPIMKEDLLDAIAECILRNHS